MTKDEKRIREFLTKQIEKYKRIRALTLRVSAILRKCGYKYSQNTWRSFDALVIKEIEDTKIRHATLKRIFSPRGARIKEDDEEVVSLLERKLFINGKETEG